MPNCVIVEQQSIDVDENTSEVEKCENWSEKLFANFKIISDVMKVKLEHKCNLVNSKQERVIELENALKASVTIATDREKDYHKLVQMKTGMDIKVSVFVLFKKMVAFDAKEFGKKLRQKKLTFTKPKCSYNLGTDVSRRVMVPTISLKYISIFGNFIFTFLTVMQNFTLYAFVRL